MSVLIKGVDMPTQCYDCYLVAQDPDGKGLYCKFLKEDIADWCSRLPNCPLIEVPTPHGRLADCDAVKECIDEVADCNDKTYALCLLDWAVSKRIVIEAEE